MLQRKELNKQQRGLWTLALSFASQATYRLPYVDSEGLWGFIQPGWKELPQSEKPEQFYLLLVSS